MAKFTFGAGNARKALRLPLYALGALAASVVPRDDRLWVVGSGIGLGEGAVPFARLVTERLAGSVRIVWLASTERELAEAVAAGFDAAPKHGRRGFWLTLRARVLVVTHGFGDVNRYATRGGFVLQLWHGIPLKRLHLDSPAALRVSFLPDHRLVRALAARAYRWAGRGISLFPVASELVVPRIVSAFGVARDRVVATGDVRDDILLRGTAPERRAAARRLLEERVGALPGTVLLYAPTWRDGAPDPSIPSEVEWRAIAGWLEAHDAALLVRAHPLGLGDYAAGSGASERIRMLGGDALTDVTPALPGIDTLITDYSSIAYDHALTGGRAVFLAPDVESYAKTRGLYQDYREFSGGRHAASWTETLARLDDAAELTIPHRDWLVREHVDRLDGNAAERVLGEVLRRTGIRLGEDAARPDRESPRIARPIVDAVRLDAAADGPELVLRVRGLDGRVDGLRLDGGRARVAGIPVPAARGDAAEFRFALLAERWGSPGLALPSGRYRVLLSRPGAEDSARLDLTQVDLDAALLRHPLFRAQLLDGGGGLVLEISPPLADDERGATAQRRLERAYRRERVEAEDAVFFESFYGRTASCNPAGIDRALATIRPDVTRYWSVVDASVPVPPGAVRLVEGSREWWRVRGSARLLVVNDWLRKRWKPRAHQTVLQTWHGTMLKRLALDRAARGLRTRIAILRERSRWDVMLAQNPYSAENFRSAYAFRGPIWEEGYPRNDVLALDDPQLVRRRLGIGDGVRVVLYAPTWRDDRTEMVDYLDLERFAGELGEDTLLLVRGHSRTLPYGRDLQASRLLDVTSYPSMADLLLVADVLVTDYSSVMFDFAATGRPIVFFTPDLAHYSEDLRGFYFDLLADAPGPVVEDRGALLAILRDPEAQTAGSAERRAAWRARFAPRDDGRAGERVVRRILEEGLLG